MITEKRLIYLKVASFFVFIIRVLILCALSAPETYAQNDGAPTDNDLQAIAHTLGFIEGIPRVGDLRIGIIYGPEESEAKAHAADIARRLAEISGPGSTTLVPEILTPGEIKGAPGDIHALIVMPDALAFAREIIAVANERHLVTVSTDPDCLGVRVCVLYVQARPRVTITLDTSLADTLDVRISPIFVMMVKRQ